MCDILLLDPNNFLWLVGVTNQGNLTTTQTGVQFALVNPILNDSNHIGWQISANTLGEIVSTETGPALTVPNMRMVAPNGLVYNMGVNTQGMMTTTLVPGQFGTSIPTPIDVSMSQWPDSIGVICPTCGNAIVSVRADFSCWCCACNMFVLPEDTTMLVVLEE